MPFELLIGLRYLKAKRKSTFISIITFISTAGVALGVMALIVVLAVMTGFEEDLKEKILGTNAVFRRYSISADADERPTEELELRGARIEWTYWPAPGASPIVGRWDVVGNKTY